jgi:hypothetical protein
MGSYWRSGQPRITAGKYTDIANTINNHTPATVDLVPLNMNLEPATLANGEQVTLFNFLVYNNSSAGWTGLVPFRVYFSTNSTISTADLLVSAQTFSYAFPAKGAVSVNGVLFHVPWTTQAGDYYAGVYLDISDYATGNNSTNGWDAVPIHINEGTLPAPQNLTASKGDYDSFVFLNWSDVSGASNYRVYRNTQNNFSTAMAVSGWVTLSYFYDYSASSGIFYYYWVVAATDGSGHCASDPSTYDYGYKNGDLACGSAISLFCGTPFNGNNTSGSYNIAQYPGCVSWNESGPEVVHTIDVYNEGVLTATLSNMSTDLDLFLFGNCDKTNCLTFGNTYVSYTVSPGTYYIVVDGFNGATGPYTLTVSCPPPPSTRYVQNVNFYSGSNWCYDATGTIIIAGAGTVFHVFSGGSADLIAGNNIYLKSGTHVYSGGYLHGLISNYYCGYQQPAALMATGGDLQENSGNLEKVLEVLTEKATGTDRQEHFKVYPNPTTGKFRIEYSLQEVGTVPALDVFSLLGKSLTLPFATGTGYAEFDLSAQPAGIYIVRIDSGGRTEFCKIMRY